MTLHRISTFSLLAFVAACIGSDAPPADTTTAAAPPAPAAAPALDAAPAQFQVRLETSKGPIVLAVHRDWSTYGVDRF